MSALDQYSYLFFVCEGKNEEAIVKWLAEADAIDFPKKQYSLDFCRARTKSTRPKILRAATQFDYGGPVAIIYVCDSHGEKWSVGKDCMGNEIPVIKIVTQTSHTENIPYALINQLELNVESHSRTLLCTQTTHPKSGQIVQESFQERFDQQDF